MNAPKVLFGFNVPFIGSQLYLDVIHIEELVIL